MCKLLKKLFPKKEPKERTGLVELTDDELSQIVGHGGLYLTETFGFTIPEDMTNQQLKQILNSNLSELNGQEDLVGLTSVYINMVKVMDSDQANEFTKMMIKEIVLSGWSEIINLSTLAGFDMQVHGLNVTVEGNITVEFRP